MKNLKLSEKKKEELSATEAASDAPQYPWGTRISLEEEQIALFPELQDVSVGDEMEATIRVRVKSVSENESEEGGKKSRYQRVELQITDMEFPADKSVDAEKLYSPKKGEEA